MFEYNSPIISMRRKGTPEDPFAPYEETLQISDGKVSLTEIPNRQDKVIVTGETITWIETEGELKQDNWYQVDYNLGVVHFKSAQNGKSLTFNYLGEGSQYVPVDRVYTKHNNGNVVETLGDIITEGTGAIESLKEVNQTIAKAELATTNANDATTFANEKAGLVQAKIDEVDNAETIRANNENTRQTNETARESAETSRINAESARESNESTRQSNETKRQTDTATAITNAETATSNANTVTQNAQQLLDTTKFLGDYSNLTSYQPNNTVRYENAIYINKLASTGVLPTNTTNWDVYITAKDVIDSAVLATNNANTAKDNAQILVDTSKHLGEYSPTTNYVVNNEVRYNGSTWRCIQNCTGITPVEGVNWTLIAQRGLDGQGAVNSVNTKVGDVVLNASDVGAIPSTDIGVTVAGFNASGQVLDKNGNVVEGAVKSVNGQTGDVVIDTETILQQDLPPEGIEEGRLWLDTSDSTYQGTVFQELDNKIGNLSTLETVEKGSLVGAINEVKNKEIDTSTLATKQELNTHLADYAQNAVKKVNGKIKEDLTISKNGAKYIANTESTGNATYELQVNGVRRGIFIHNTPTGNLEIFKYGPDGTTVQSKITFETDNVNINGTKMFRRSDSPEGNQVGNVGDLCTVWTMGLFIKVSGTGNAGWKQVQTL